MSMDPNSPAMMAAMRAYQKQDYEKSVIADKGAGNMDYSSAGPPTWNLDAWEAFHRQYGFYPFSATELPPSFDGAPDWVYQKMNLRKPPVTVTMRNG